ncbi:hypothetical protein PENTCL1PPCAC_21235, partial [Pristionchus entomophagus]
IDCRYLEDSCPLSLHDSIASRSHDHFHLTLLRLITTNVRVILSVRLRSGTVAEHHPLQYDVSAVNILNIGRGHVGIHRKLFQPILTVHHFTYRDGDWSLPPAHAIHLYSSRHHFLPVDPLENETVLSIFD